MIAICTIWWKHEWKLLCAFDLDKEYLLVEERTNFVESGVLMRVCSRQWPLNCIASKREWHFKKTVLFGRWQKLDRRLKLRILLFAFGHILWERNVVGFICAYAAIFGHILLTKNKPIRIYSGNFVVIVCKTTDGIAPKQFQK